MEGQHKAVKNHKNINLWPPAIGIICLWSLFIIVSWIWLTQVIQSGTIETARIEARTVFHNDLIYRQWNANHGGVYVPVSPDTPPNKYLKTKHREIQTPDGITLTKINPAYMTRQVHVLATKNYGYKNHITSLNPIRPQNVPDPWETKALKLFEKGKTEVSSVEIMDKTNYLRLMRPLITGKKCLTCHAKQGYKIGNIRGGISIAIPLSPLTAIERTNIITLSLIYGFLWIIGVAGTLLGLFFLKRQIKKRHQAEEQLREHHKMEGVMEMAGAVCHELNQPLQMILGNSEIILMEMEPDHPLAKQLQNIQKQVERMSRTTRNLIKITNYETKQFPQGKIIDIDKASEGDGTSNNDQTPE
ncbi:MAG: DUF3365 domain-containing protein [Desulfobacteraceae bacterium]|nr:DUF3365 domain-containing protein [Desulfobacteraceae bacterium]